MSIYSGNRYLTLSEMKVNAKYIYDFLITLGWTSQAICGMLGNMQTESTINPAIWQSLKEGRTDLGYGLVQWTPATKYLGWCSENGLVPSEMDSNLLRILYEVDNGLQFYHPEMSFRDFTQSQDFPYNLGMIFLNYYERPANRDQPNRGTQSDYWYEYLTGLEPPIDPPDPPPPSNYPKAKNSFKVYMYVKKKRRITIETRGI